jgi:F-type H+-transporting ATPase subunit beta
MAVAEAVKIGKVVQIIGPVVDIEFAGGELPAIYNAVRVTGDAGGEKVDIIVEVEQHLGENRVRTVAMKPTDGLQRGMTAEDQGGPISMPVGPETLGRVLNVLGEPVSIAVMPRVMPSVGFIATARTRFSPRCCSTSHTTSIVSPPGPVVLIRTAL